MERKHLFEFNDQPWLPAPVRKAQRDFLAFGGNLTRAFYREFIGHLRAGLEATGETRLIELCAGAGGPTPTLVALLKEQGCEVESVLLTDLFPDAERFEQLERESGGLFRAARESVDATKVPATLQGFRLLCNAFHHFRPEQAEGILRDSVEKRQGICILELSGRTPSSMAWITTLPLMIALTTPFIRPARPASWLLTFALPVVPLLTLFDGLVSCLRVYSPAELRALTDKIGGDYIWDIGLAPVAKTPIHLTYLVGYPRERVAAKGCASA